jgi:23S rRNA-/tRNA-specific pseudouridylate synthase
VSKEYRALLVAPSPLGASREACALVDGGFLRRPVGVDDLWQLRHDVEGRESITEFTELARTPCAVDGALADVSLYPRTGRRHQLRRACESLGAPILGDDLYCATAVARRRIGACARAIAPGSTGSPVCTHELVAMLCESRTSYLAQPD